MLNNCLQKFARGRALLGIRMQKKFESSFEYAKRCTAKRRIRKKEWLAEVLHKAAQGDHVAVRYFKKRQGIQGMHATYIHKAGGPLRVVAAQLQAFYESKYTPDRDDSQLAQAVLHAHVSGHSPPIQCITVDQINFVLGLCNTGKPCGTEGVPYELLQCIMQTDLADEIVEFMNSVLNGSVKVPPNWLVKKVAFLAKSEPGHLRPMCSLRQCVRRLRRFCCYGLG